jgi:dGTPase
LFREGSVAARLEFRTEYHRDRDRIVWSKSFKRLQHKTQIFPHYFEDHYRRRLTHSLEVAQIATTIARALGLNEVATEAIALGHDLGHTPFGHAGEEALNRIMREECRKHHIDPAKYSVPVSGFDHCVHAIEVLSRIEQEYEHETGQGGLNLTFDVRDGILKHMYERPDKPERPLSNLSDVTSIPKYRVYANNKGALEAQCVYFADKIAYFFGDIEDGLRSGILPCHDLMADDFLRVLIDKYAAYRGRPIDLRISRVAEFPLFRSRTLTVMILNCIDNSLSNLGSYSFGGVDDVLACNTRLVWVGDELGKTAETFYNKWMNNYLFKHENVVACGFKARNIVTALFEACRDNEDLINKSYREHCQRAYGDVCDPKSDLFRLILARNYVAGMTDSFAIQQHARLFMSSEHIPV